MAEITRFINTFIPAHYDIYLDINRETKTIAGHTTINGEALISPILIHQKYLTISEVLVDGQAATFTLNPENDALAIDVPATGALTLDIVYTSTLTDNMTGIYPSYYQLDGVAKQLVSTQFETNFARQAFPSVDEPEAKATFDLAVKWDEQAGETILANMPETKVVDGYHHFATTVRMATYLVAFGFGDLQGKETTTTSGVQVGVFATKAHAAKELDFALDIAKRSIEFFEDYYQTSYPLPHSWQLALPDFSAGAMENWGLVTYREAYLLVDPDNTALQTKQLVATVIAHELAHQWFGDLVTMKWWDDLWLNESFANMMEYVAIDALEPDWHIWEMFQTSDVLSALNRDATDGVQSVHVEVKHPAEIDSLFDPAIVYAKGARALVMVRALIGDDALRAGLKAYFAAHKYGNSVGADLWTALGNASGQDINAVMDTWLEQPGYPVVSASVKNGKLVITQEQFFIGEHADANRTWQIPLNSNYSAAPAIMTDHELALGSYGDLRTVAGVPFRLNLGNNSHFIVKYDVTLLADILEHIDALDPITQLQILHDLSLLAESQQVSYADIVPLLPRFADSQAYVVNSELYRIVNKLKQFVTAGSPEEGQLKQFVGQLSANNYARLGWSGVVGQTNDDIIVREHVISAALYAENAAAIAHAHELFVANAAHLSALSADVRAFVLRTEIEHFGTPAIFGQLLSEYKVATDSSYQVDLRYAITKVSDATLITQVVTGFQDSSVVKPQDLRGWFANLLISANGQQAAWDWLRAEWGWLEAKLGGDMEFGSYITVIAQIFKTPTRLAEFKAFFTPKIDQPGLTREITMDTQVIASRVALITSQAATVNAAVEAAVK